MVAEEGGPCRSVPKKLAFVFCDCFLLWFFLGQTIPEFNIVALPEYDLALLPTSQLV